MSDKPNTNNKKQSKFPTRCHQCQYFNAEKDKCKKRKDKYIKDSDKCDIDFSQCDSYLVRENLIMY